MKRITLSSFALAVCAAGLPLAAHGTPPKAAPRPAVILDSSNRYSLDDAVKRPDGQKVLVLKLRLAGGGGKTWVTENCNPVMPVVDGKTVLLKQCLTNYYSSVVLKKGRGETLTFEWPVDSTDAPLKPNHNYRLAVSLATDCRRTGGPGLFALGDCRTTRVVMSPTFRIKGGVTAPPAPTVPVVRLLDGHHYSLARAVTGADGRKSINFRIMLSGGGDKFWVAESCNPVLPVVDDKPVALNQCITNFYSQGVLDHGKGELMTFAWPVDAANAPLKPGGGYRLAVSLATDCIRTQGPGLFGLGDCKTTRVVLSPEFTITP